MELKHRANLAITTLENVGATRHSSPRTISMADRSFHPSGTCYWAARSCFDMNAARCSIATNTFSFLANTDEQGLFCEIGSDVNIC
jgi:hypothetical protein